MSRTILLGPVVACAALAACAAPAERPAVAPSYDPTSGRLQTLAYDSNGDGRPDMTAFMDGSIVVRVEVDEDFDGRVDRWERYARPAGAADADQAPVVERIERSTRHDGIVDRRETFSGGVLSRAEEDRDGDGRIDRWETYAGGGLASVALDTLGRGTPDRRITYSADGVRIEDGKDADLAPAGDPAPRR